MDKLWAGRFSKSLNELADSFNSSIKIDSKMVFEDIEGSIAHATMLGDVGILSMEDSKLIVATLKQLADEIEKGDLAIDYSYEDVHTFVEKELTKRIGDVGKKLHTARSRNDQVALDIRLYLRKEIKSLQKATFLLLDTIVTLAKEHVDTVMSGYTHLQKAQPITFAHYLLCYANMFIRDYGRLTDCYKRMNYCPLGSSALAGTTYNIDRKEVSDYFGFIAPTANSLDGVSDRDFVIELLSEISISMMHLSRLSEELIIWSSWEFKYVEMSDEYSTGSSIMPQKKNPDIAELIRGKTGRTYGNLMAMLTTMKGLPLAYNKDMQEDKESVFDSIHTLFDCLTLASDMLKTIKVNSQKMKNDAEKGYINATDCADYLTKKGMPFRDSYKLIGELVAYAIGEGKSLNELSLSEYKAKSEMFEEDVYEAISLTECINKRVSYGGPSKKCVLAQIQEIEEILSKLI